jgi:hypothetical protein
LNFPFVNINAKLSTEEKNKNQTFLLLLVCRLGFWPVLIKEMMILCQIIYKEDGTAAEIGSKLQGVVL